MMSAVRREAKRRRSHAPAWIGTAAAAVLVVFIGAAALGGFPMNAGAPRQSALYAAEADIRPFTGAAAPVPAAMPSAAPAAAAPVSEGAAGAGDAVMFAAPGGGRSAAGEGALLFTNDLPQSPMERGVLGDSGETVGEKVITTLNISFQTLDFDADAAALEAMTAEYGGYAQSSGMWGSPYTQPGGRGRTTEMTLRVPAESASAMASALRALGVSQSYSAGTEDVTMSYLDSQARLTAYQSQMDQLNALMARGEKIEDVLTVQSQVTDLIYQMESVKGQMRYYDQRSAYATITVSARETQPRTAVITPPETMGGRVRATFFDTLNGMSGGGADFLVWLAGTVPVLILLLAVGGMAYAVIRTASRRKQI